ncbi:uncharacterized protein LOC105684187 isoform X2 [Athalia rosae]|uniref:uncharacterized protein LOC105684187 isoform X2 n=1 Tax=Athalia rosae TaxID=37344 RepID=UPI0020336ACD|nr:uncharacterized protein LOC105684187 isoform X2 [Athalia rosae]
MLNCCGRSVAKKKKPNSSNMGLTVTEDTPADMLAGNMELLVQLPPRSDNDYDDDYEEEEEALHHQHHRNHRDRHHNHHHNNGHHPRRATTNGINARRVTVARSTPMMDLLVQVATSQKLSASSYTLEAIGEHGLVLTHHPNTPIGALDALQVKLLPKQGTFAPVKTRHANQPFEPTFRLQVHLPRNQLYVSRVSSRMNLGKILEEVCREKNLDRSNYELCHPANLEEKLDLSLSLQDYHLQEVTLCPKRRSLGSSLSSQDIMALQRQEERRRQDARHTVFGFAFKKSKESSVSTDSLGERSISPARSDGTGRSASPLQVPTAPPTRPQRKRRPAPKPPIQQEQHPDLDNGAKETGKEREIEKEKIVVISHSRNSSDSSGYHEASVLSDNLDSNIRIPETLPRRSKAQPQPLEPPPRTLAESSQASKSLGNLAFVPTNNRASIARGTSNTSLVSTGLRKKKAAPAPPQPRPLSSAISTQALERIVDSEESLTSGGDSPPAKASSDVAATCRPSLVTSQSLSSDDSEPITVTISKMETENNDVANPPSPEVLKKEETGVVEKPTPKKRSTVVQPFVAIAETGDQFDVAETATEIVTHNVEPARDRKRGEPVPVPKPRNKLVTTNTPISESPKVQPSRQLEVVPIIDKSPLHKVIIEPPATNTRDLHVESTHRLTVGSDNKIDEREELRRNSLTTNDIERSVGPSKIVAKETDRSREMISDTYGEHNDRETSRRHGANQPPKKPRRKTVGTPDPVIEEKLMPKVDVTEKQVPRISGVPNVIIQSWDSTVNRTVTGKRVSKKFAQLQKKFEEPLHSLPIYLTNDIKRSCAVISTIPKCDHFEKNASPSIDEKKDSSLGLPFGTRAGKLIWDSSYQREDQRSAGKTVKITNVTGDELELEDISLEMFEESKRPRDRSKLLRSNSVLNDYEINTFENSGRALTSKSVDFTFALNPNLSRNISDLSTDSYPHKYSKKYYSEDDGIASEDINRGWKSSTATNFPPFFRRGISWDRRQMVLPAGGEEYEAGEDVWTVGESAPTANDGRNDLTAPITDAEATSELLKKVSDTLSGSSRSPAVALISTSGNVSPKEQQQIKVCVDAPGESKIRINQPQTIADDNLTRRDVTNSSEKSLDEKTIESNVADDPGRTEIEDSLRDSVQNESLAAAETTDWEYQLPEPPTAFRDTEDNENRKGSSTISLEKRSADVESTDSAVNTDTEISNNAVSSTSDEKTKSRKNDEVSATRSPKTSTSVNEAINSDTNFQTRTLDSATLERGRVSRSRPVKPLGDSAARRPSHAVSTPSVAPVDNPLSNFTITTYSRPKPVEILNEIEQRDDELQPGILGRKGSAGQTELFAAVPQQNRRHTATAIFVTKNASQSSKTYMTLPRNEKSAQPEIPPKKIEPAEGEVMKEIDDQQVQINSDANNTNVSRSNVRISIVTKPRPRANTLTDIVLSKNQTFDVINGNETVGSSEEQRKDSAPESYDKSSQSGESILNKQETPDKEKQLQSLEILKSISPQLDDARKTSRDDGMSENTDSVTSKETRSQNDVKNEPPTDENPKNSVPATVENTKPSEPKMKRYTYSGPPAIDLGSWSERSRTKVQIKPDSDYKFEKSKSPEIITPAQTTPAPIIRESPSNAGPKIGTTSVIIQNETPTPVFPVQPVGITAAKNSRFERDRAAEIDNRDRKESNELAKTLIARTTATGFTRRPVSAVFEPSGVSTLTRLRKKEPEEEKVVGAQGRLHNQTPEKDEIDSTPINFKQLKETFGKEQLTNSQSRPNYGTYGRPKSEYNTSGSAVRRDSNVVLSNGESEKVAPVSNYSTLQRISTIGPARVMSGAENTKVHEKPSSISSQEKRNFVVSTNRLGYNQVSEATGPGGVRRTSRGNLMPVVKGFKVTTLEGEGAATLPNNKDKQPNNYGRVAIGDISNGNYVATHNGLKKTVVQIRGDDFTNGIPKPPPTMPVITGVTLKSTNANNSRPKSIGGQADPRSELLEAIKGFGGTSQLRRVPRRSMNISGIQI